MEAVWPLFIHLAPPSGGYDREEEKQHSLYLLRKLRGLMLIMLDVGVICATLSCSWRQ